MSSPNIEIHEFSTGIHFQQMVNGWVSLGFTGQYMNATINPIPQVVERSIANQEFDLREGSSTEKPAIIGRIVGGGDDTWSVMAVVTRGQDEGERSAAFHRYFLCQGDHNLRFILTWWEQNQKPTFNPLDFQGSPHLFMGESGQPHRTKEDESLPFEQDQAIVLPAENQCDLYTLNALAIRKKKECKNGLPVAWAFNVEALEKPERFQVIQPASQRAYDGLKRAIANASQVVSAINVDEAALKSAIRSLMNSSTVKPEAVQEIVKGLENKEIESDYWESLFNAQGADKAIKQKIYSSQMVRLITLKAMVIPESLPQFLAWLNIQAGKKPDANQTVSLDFQKVIRASFPKEQLTKGIRYLLLNLLNKKISVDSLCWLLMIDGSAWVYAQKEFIADIRDDLQLIYNHFSSPRTSYKSSSYTDPNSVLTSSSSFPPQNDSQSHHVQPPIKKDSWQDNFKYQKQIWANLINSWQGIQQGYYKIEEYQPFAELFENLRQYDLAAYFYQVSDRVVKKELFYEVASLKNRRSNIVVFGLEIEPKKTLIDYALDVCYFIIEEDVVKIYQVGIISLIVFTSGLFLGKTFLGNTVKNAETPANIVTETGQTNSFDQPGEQPEKEIIENAIQKSNWDKTSTAIKKIINDPKYQDKKDQFIFEKIIQILDKDINIQYSNLNKLQKDQKKKIANAIYSFQSRKNISNPKGYLDETSQTGFDKLKTEVQKQKQQ